jgi:hypothetical protein
MKSLIIKILLLSNLLALTCFRAEAQNMALSVIANPKGAPDNLKMNELRIVLRGEKLRWADGSKVVIALMKTNTPIGTSTCSQLYKMSSNDLRKMFLALVFQGKGEGPIFFDTMRELQAFVKETPGAIGVIDASASYSDKVISIEGKKSI